MALVEARSMICESTVASVTLVAHFADHDCRCLVAQAIAKPFEEILAEIIVL